VLYLHFTQIMQAWLPLTILGQVVGNARFNTGPVAERWETNDPVWWRPPREDAYRLLTDADVETLRAEFAANRRDHVLTG